MKKIPDKIAENFEPYRSASETVVSAFPAMTHNQFLAMTPLAISFGAARLMGAESWLSVILPFLGCLPLFWFLAKNNVFTIVATTERTVVARSLWWSSTKVEYIAHDVPIEIKIGPPSGFFHNTDALGVALKFHWRAFGLIRKADERNAPDRGTEAGSNGQPS